MLTLYSQHVARKDMKRRSLFFLLLTFVFRAQAGELFGYNISPRAHGMGGVTSLFPRPTEATFVNPAALSKVEQLGWEIADVSGGYNGQAAYTAFSALGAGGTAAYNGVYGKKIWVGANGYSSMVFPNFSFALFDNIKVNGELNKPPFPDFDMAYLNDSGFQASVGFDIDSVFSWGATLKRITRTGGEMSLGLSTIAAASANTIQNQFSSAGTGWSSDLALMARGDGPFSPRMVAMWKDPGSLEFVLSNGTINPPRIRDNFILGVGTLLNAPGLDWSTGLEFQHISETGIQLGKKVHMGTEVSLPLVDLRAGAGQGYQSYGAGINLFFIKVDAAYYTVEKGDYPGQTPDLRYEVSFSINIAVDADFKETGKDGKRRRLKQRR